MAHRGFLSKRRFFTRALFLGKDVEISELLVESLRKAPSRHCFFHFQHMGGAVADGRQGAFSSRDAEWSLVISAAWAADESDCSSWVTDLVQRLLPMTLGCYATDLGPNDVDLASQTFGNSAERLLRLKREWDPDNMFRHGFPLSQLMGGRPA